MLAKQFDEAGFKIVATKHTAATISEAGIPVTEVKKLHEGRPNIMDELTNGKILVVFNEFSTGQSNMIAKWKATATLNTATVPEPATATLSLLALAGLAARRRRR